MRELKLSSVETRDKFSKLLTLSPDSTSNHSDEQAKEREKQKILCSMSTWDFCWPLPDLATVSLRTIKHRTRVESAAQRDAKQIASSCHTALPSPVHPSKTGSYIKHNQATITGERRRRAIKVENSDISQQTRTRILLLVDREEIIKVYPESRIPLASFLSFAYVILWRQ